MVMAQQRSLVGFKSRFSLRLKENVGHSYYHELQSTYIIILQVLHNGHRCLVRI